MQNRTTVVCECRFFAEDVPAAFRGADRLAGCPVIARSIPEIDVYLLTESLHYNAKLRYRSNTLKLKTLRARATDGVERWSIDVDEALPAAASAWGTVLEVLKCGADATALAACGDGEAAGRILARSLPANRMVTVNKERWLYGDGARKVDVARLAFGSRRAASIGVEGPEPADVRALLGGLDLSALGQPRNYMELLLGQTEKH